LETWVIYGCCFLWGAYMGIVTYASDAHPNSCSIARCIAAFWSRRFHPTERSDRRLEGSTDLVCCLCRAPLEALFADSVATGRRSKIYTWRGMVNSLARGLG
jgi:hypothetical protein